MPRVNGKQPLDAEPTVFARGRRAPGPPLVHVLSMALVLLCTMNALAQTKYPDRFVWVFGWNLSQDRQVDEISEILATASKHGMNGAVVSAGLDRLSNKKPEFFKRLNKLQDACKRYQLELIPAIFSVGYGGTALANDRNLAEGLPVEDALFIAQSGKAVFVPDGAVRLVNGGFDEYTGNRFKGYRFHDQPGEVSFVDTSVKHSGRASSGWMIGRWRKSGH